MLKKLKVLLKVIKRNKCRKIKSNENLNLNEDINNLESKDSLRNKRI